MKKLISVLGLVSLLAIGLSSCAPASSVVANTTLNLGQDTPATSLNAGVAASESEIDSNSYISQLTQSAFFEPDATGALAPNTKFGYIKTLSNSAESFVISYTVHQKVTWSDGAPIDGVDLLLSWAAAVNLADAGFKSSLSNTGLAAANVATLGVSNRRIYLTYAHPVADWQSAAQLTVPAHLVANAAFGSQSDFAAAKAKIADAILNKNVEELKKIATAYNEAFSLTSGDFDLTKAATSGAYVFEKASSSEVVLKARTDCFWCRAATVETLNLHFYENAGALMAAIEAAEVDLAEAIDTSSLPLATLVANLDKLSAQGYKYSSLQSGKIEALILNYTGNSLFSPDVKRHKPETAAKIKEAFLNLVPRQRIVDSLGIPIKLVRADSFAYLSTQQDYSAVIQQNGSANYRIQDAEKAAEILKKVYVGSAGAVRILFSSADLNSQITFNLINQYASDTKMQVVNASSSNVQGVIASGQYEAYLTKIDVLSASSSALGAIQTASSSPKNVEIDALIAKIAADPSGASSNQNLADIDAKLFEIGYGLPLYELPKVVVFSGKLQNYATPVGSNSAVSNFELWTVSPEKQK